MVLFLQRLVFRYCNATINTKCQQAIIRIMQAYIITSYNYIDYNLITVHLLQFSQLHYICPPPLKACPKLYSCSWSSIALGITRWSGGYSYNQGGGTGELGG